MPHPNRWYEPRADSMASVMEKVRSRGAVVVAGPGGMGKTQIAKQLAFDATQSGLSSVMSDERETSWAILMQSGSNA